jgi:hypothetical protein
MKRLTVLCALTLEILAVHAHATTILPADLGELAHDAVAIVRGRVASVDAQWTEDRRTVETIVTLESERYLKGSLGSIVRFRVAGGELGRLRTIVVGAPEFAVDQHVIVFLGAAGPTIPHIVGFNQGIFRLAPGGDAGWVVATPANWPAVNRSTAIVRGDLNRRSMALTEFEERVRALVGGGR